MPEEWTGNISSKIQINSQRSQKFLLTFIRLHLLSETSCSGKLILVVLSNPLQSEELKIAFYIHWTKKYILWVHNFSLLYHHISTVLVGTMNITTHHSTWQSCFIGVWWFWSVSIPFKGHTAVYQVLRLQVSCIVVII